MSPSKVLDFVCTEPPLRHRTDGSLTWSWLLYRVLFVPSYRRFWVTPLPPLPRHFGRTAVVFRRYRPPSSIRCRVHPLVSLALLLSSSCLRRPAPRCGRLPWGSPTSSRRQLRESTSGGHPKPTFVPPPAFRTLSTACSSQNLAGLFHPAATSRFRAPGVSSLVPAVPPRRWPFPPRRWRRPPVTGCPVTPAGVASTSRSCSGPRSAASTEGLAPHDARIPSCASLLRASLHQSWRPRYGLLRSGFDVRCSLCPGR